MSPSPPPCPIGKGLAGLSTLSDAARAVMTGRRGGGPLFLGDWIDATFLHYEVDPGLLAAVVPFPLDLRDGRAFVSLVAFTMRRFRPARGGRLGAWLTRPLATQRYLNLRTYVRGIHGPGIFFLREWLDHPLAVRLGTPAFGLPLRPGELNYRDPGGSPSGSVKAGATGRFAGPAPTASGIAAAGSREEFLLERYLAYTAAGRRPLAFRVWHEPWIAGPFEPWENTMAGFLRALRKPWTETLRFAGAAHSRGVRDVWMGRRMRA